MIGRIGRARGFTLVEMLIVVSIMGILAMMVVPMAEVAATRDKEKSLRQGLWQIRQAIDQYKRAVDEGRIAATTPSGYPASLLDLTRGVPDQRNGGARIYFLRRLPVDPFVAAPAAPEQGWGLRSYESPGDAPRPGADVFDVFSLSTRAGLNGVPVAKW